MSSKSLRHSYASDCSWLQTDDWPARTAKARAALEQKFIDQAGGDVKRAAVIRRAYYKNLTLKSIAARKARKAGK